MIQTNQSTISKGSIKKTVTIIYGSDANERSRVLKEKISSKNSFELFEKDAQWANVTAIRSSSEPIDIYYSDCLAIDEFTTLIEGKKAILDNGKRISNPQLVFSIAEFSLKEINYFEKMAHVQLISCGKK